MNSFQKPFQPRPMTPQEKIDYKLQYPNLDVDAAVVTGPNDTHYNCVAFSLGVTDQVYWPGFTLAEFDQFYEADGAKPAADGDIAVWGLSTSDMEHACVRGAGHGPRWESKIGPYLRIQHGLAELRGTTFGDVQEFYTEPTAHAPLSVQVVEPAERASYPLNEEMRAKLEGAVAKVDKDLRLAFEGGFEAWKSTWYKGKSGFSSNPYARARGLEFDYLKSLGITSVPLVVRALNRVDNFMALPLFEALTSADPLLVRPFDVALRKRLSEQERSRIVVNKWLARI